MHVPYTCSRCRIEGKLSLVRELNEVNYLEKVFMKGLVQGEGSLWLW